MVKVAFICFPWQLLVQGVQTLSVKSKLLISPTWDWSIFEMLGSIWPLHLHNFADVKHYSNILAIQSYLEILWNLGLISKFWEYLDPDDLKTQNLLSYFNSWPDLVFMNINCCSSKVKTYFEDNYLLQLQFGNFQFLPKAFFDKLDFLEKW